MAELFAVSGDLELGIQVGGIRHFGYTLRRATLADTYRAVESVPVPADIDANPAARVAYQMAVDDAQVLCQITRLGTLDPIPSPAALAAELDPDDMAILRQAAADLKKKLRPLKKYSPPTGEPSTSLSEPASS